MDISSSITDKLAAASEFIAANSSTDPTALRLACSGKTLPFDTSFAIDQIECRRKTVVKLKPFISNPGFAFPSVLAAEQASCWQVAAFHSSLISGSRNILDMTAGLGIDAMTIALAGCNVTACEMDGAKAEALRHNSHVMGIDSLVVVNDDSCSFLENSDEYFDCIFIDPARRGESNRRTHAFSDCSPDVLKLMPLMRDKAKKIFIKASPLLDVSEVFRLVPEASAIYSVSVGGECKEILVEIPGSLHNDYCSVSPVRRVEARIIDSEGRLTASISIPFDNDYSKPRPVLDYADNLTVGSYIYIPDAAVMKISPWGELCAGFHGLRKAAESSHLFVSDSLHSQFPGRVFRITSLPDKKELSRLKGTKLNVIARNYPLRAEQLKKRYGLADGGDKFLIAFRLDKNPTTVIAEKMTPPII